MEVELYVSDVKNIYSDLIFILVCNNLIDNVVKHTYRNNGVIHGRP